MFINIANGLEEEVSTVPKAPGRGHAGPLPESSTSADSRIIAWSAKAREEQGCRIEV